MLSASEIRGSFLQAMTRSLEGRRHFGARNYRKLFAPHRWIAKTALAQLGGGFRVNSLGVGDGREKTARGKYYDKPVDVAVEKIGARDPRTVAVASFMFAESARERNGVERFERLLGEAANFRRAGVGFAHLLVVRKDTPYFRKGGEGEPAEKITEDAVAKHIRLFRDMDFPHKPEVLGIALVDFGGGQARFCEEDPDLGFSAETTAALREDLSVERFAEKFVRLCQFLA